MLFVIAGWVLFRATDFTTAAQMLTAMVGLGDGFALTQAIKPELAIAAAVAVLGPTTKTAVEGGLLRPAAYQGFALGAILAATVLAVGRGHPQTFIYFQF
jgi:hypothetical protein